MPWPSNIFLLSSSSGRRQPGEFSIELCQIGDVNVVEQFVSQRVCFFNFFLNFGMSLIRFYSFFVN